MPIHVVDIVICHFISENSDLLVALEGKISQVARFVIWVPRMFAQKSRTIKPVDVEVFHRIN